MNTSTGHLVRDLELAKGPRDAYSSVPAELRADADRALAGRDEAYVDLAEGSRLAQWAAKDRRERRDRKKREKKNRQEGRRRRRR